MCSRRACTHGCFRLINATNVNASSQRGICSVVNLSAECWTYDFARRGEQTGKAVRRQHAPAVPPACTPPLRGPITGEPDCPAQIAEKQLLPHSTSILHGLVIAYTALLYGIQIIVSKAAQAWSNNALILQQKDNNDSQVSQEGPVSYGLTKGSLQHTYASRKPLDTASGSEFSARQGSELHQVGQLIQKWLSMGPTFHAHDTHHRHGNKCRTSAGTSKQEARETDRSTILPATAGLLAAWAHAKQSGPCESSQAQNQTAGAVPKLTFRQDQHPFPSSCYAGTRPKADHMMRPGYLPLRSSKKNSSSVRGGDDRKTDSTCMYNNLEQPANINISPWYPQIMLMSIMYSAANANLQYCAQLGDMNSSKERYCDTAQSISACRECSMMQLAGRHLPMGPCRQYTTAATASHHVKLAKARQARRRCQRTAARLKRMHYYTFRSKDTAILEYPRTVVELHLRLTYDEDEPLRVDLIAGEFHNCHGYANVQIMPSTDPSRPVSLLIDASPYRIYKVCSALNCKMPQDMRCNNLPNNKSQRHPRAHPQ